MRRAYHEQLSALIGQLWEMCGMTSQAIQRATEALLQADLELAESVIVGQADMAAMSSHVEETAFVSDDQLKRLITACQGKSLQDRRDDNA